MNKRIEKEGTCRLVNADKLSAYLSIGKNAAIRYGNAAGARVKIGKSVRWDLKKIDAAINAAVTE